MPAKVFDSERAIVIAGFAKEAIWREFADSVRALVPLFETEIRGVPMLKRLCDAIFADAPLKPSS
jgi:hypothetical protein